MAAKLEANAALPYPIPYLLDQSPNQYAGPSTTALYEQYRGESRLKSNFSTVQTPPQFLGKLYNLKGPESTSAK